MSTKFSMFDINSAKPKRERKKIPVGLNLVKAPEVRIKKKASVIGSLATFVVGTFVIVFLLQTALYLSAARNAKGEILGAATSAYSDLSNAGKNLGSQDFASAANLFESALGNIQIAQDELNNYRALTWFTPQAASADHILMGAGYLASAGEKLTSGLSLFNNFSVSSKGIETANFELKIKANRVLLTQAKDLIDQASVQFGQVSSIPTDYENTLATAKSQVSQLGSLLEKLIGLENLYIDVFEGQKTYLLIFQNYDEARATGGFIGTYGVLKISDGSISKLSIKSIYDLDGQIFEQIAAPGPLQPDIKRWGIRDSNWFADFPTSAQKLLYFFEKGGETADGIISVTPKMFEDMLKLVGPIEMKDYGVTLTAENFQDTVQYKTSIDYDHQLNKPKQMLADFAPILLDRLSGLPHDQWLTMFQIFQNNLNSRQILLYNKNPEAQQNIENLGVSGKILPADLDYLSIVNTNLGGTKTDLKMQETADLKIKILSDGSILDTLTVDRKNTSELANRDYLRILVPEGSQFVSASGFDDTPMYSSVAAGLRQDPDLANWDKGEIRSNAFVRTEAGKTEIAGWLNVAGGEEKSITVTYMLPKKLNQVYSLLVQKQSGSIPIVVHATASLGKYQLLQGNLSYESTTNTDDIWGFVVK